MNSMRSLITEEARAMIKRQPLADLIGADIGLQRDGREYKACCPFHQEDTPSFTVFAKEGVWRFCCFGCGEKGDALDWVTKYRRMPYRDAVNYLTSWSGGSVSAQPRERVVIERTPDWTPVHPIPKGVPSLMQPFGRTCRIYNPKRAGTDREYTTLNPAHVANYRDAYGAALAYVLRCEFPDGGKFTPQVTWCVPTASDGVDDPVQVGRWCLWPMADPRPLYGLDRLAARPDAPVLLMFGEKKTDAVQEAMPEVVVLSIVGGDQGRLHTDLTPLAGRRVLVAPDNDRSGSAAARGIYDSRGVLKPGVAQLALEAGAVAVKVLGCPEDAPRGWDLGDALASGWTGRQLRAYIRENAMEVGPPLSADGPQAGTVAPPPQETPQAVEEEPVVEEGPQAALPPAAAPAVLEPGQANAVERRDGWDDLCLTGSQGQVLGNVANGLIALRMDPAWEGVVAYDDMLRTPILRKPIPRFEEQAPRGSFKPRPLSDIDITLTQEWLQVAGLHSIGKDATHQAIETVAHENAFHPVRDYLDGLAWDGVPRLAGGTTSGGDIVAPWLVTYVGAENTPYTAEIGRMFLISMVARIYDPGCQCDYMLILEGRQGLRKTSICRTLGGDFFSESMPSEVTAKDAQQHLRGKWLIEFGEMHAMSKSEVTAVKAFVTRRVEIYRPPYGRMEVHEPRQCVFIGTTNKEQYLRDETGARRFWPVRAGTDGQKCRTEELARDRDQLFAEAVHRYRAGETWWPSGDFERAHIQPEQDARFEADAWEGIVAEYIGHLDRVTLLDIARNALQIEKARLGTAEQRRITAVLEKLGWTRGPRGGSRGEFLWLSPTENRAAA